MSKHYSVKLDNTSGETEILIDDGSATYVAKVYKDDAHKDAEKTATLFAAAPELFAACKRYSEMTNEDLENLPLEEFRAIALAAIEKAEGSKLKGN